MKTASNDMNLSDTEYSRLIDEGLKELKEIQESILRNRLKTAKLRESSRRVMEDTQEILRRVEANL